MGASIFNRIICAQDQIACRLRLARSLRLSGRQLLRQTGDLFLELFDPTLPRACGDGQRALSGSSDGFATGGPPPATARRAERRLMGLTGFGTFRIEAGLSLAGRHAAGTRVYAIPCAGHVPLLAGFTRWHTACQEFRRLL